jgi:uncharacterized repeat protein (TIGR02543 family)
MNKKLARAVAMAMTGTALSLGGAPDALAAATTMYNMYRGNFAGLDSVGNPLYNGTNKACAPCNNSSTVPSGVANDAGGWTDGWVWSANPQGAGDGNSTTPAFGITPIGETASTASPDRPGWIGTGGAKTTPFGYAGSTTLHWAVQFTGSVANSAEISNFDSRQRYNQSADVDTARGAWSDNALTGAGGWRHDLDFGLFKSDVTGPVTLSAVGVSGDGTTKAFGFTIFKGMDTSTGAYNHHGAWNAGNNTGGVTSASLPGGGFNLKTTDIVAYSVGGASPQNLNTITFDATAGQVYTIVLGGYKNGGWTDTTDGYKLTISQPAPAATKYTLTVSTTATGTGVSGSVTSNTGGINCTSGGAGCSAEFSKDASVTLTAKPGSNSKLDKWGSDCSSAGTNASCTLTMNANKNATAAFITASTPTQYKLTVTKPANGTITGTGINCGVSTSDCEETFTAATNVALTATAATGYQFSSWTGCSSTTSSCTVNVNGNPTTVSAAFAVIPPSGQFALTVTNGGNGKITSSPAGIDCGTTCSAPFNSGTQVTLTATPDSGYQFTGWSGACSGTATCTVTVDAAKSVTANFASTSPGQFALTVTNGGNGKVTSSPAGIDCGATCSASFDSGTAVALTATPDQGFQFAGWSGACSGTDACSVTMSEARSVTASFAAAGPGPYALTVGKRGSGSVTSSPAGIDCGGTCSASFDSDTLVTLTATPSTGWQFAGWSGACDGANTCTVSMDTARTITAAFIQPPLRDFDGDGRADLFWRQARTGRNNLWLMLGKSLKASSSVSAKGKAWSIAAVADFDGDKRADVLWRQNRTGQNQLWLMDAERVKSIVVLPDQATTYTAARTGDFDRDGKMDIIWASPSTSEVSLWLMDGASFRSAVPLPASLTGYALSEVDDFNGDNQPDVWWFNASTGENSLWLMAGTNLQSTATPPNQSADWMLAGSGLFGNDLNADVLWRNRTTGENEIWLMEGGNQIAVVPLPNLARRWAVAGVDDFNHDGQPDIFWRRPGNGQNRMWLMNGAEPSRRAQVTALSRGWATPSH